MLIPSDVVELKAFFDIASVRIQCALDQLAIGQRPDLDSALGALRQAITATEGARALAFDITPEQQRQLWELTNEIQRNLCVLLLAHGVTPSLPATRV